jgi:hypothetical protein
VILDPSTVEHIRTRYGECSQVAALCRSHVELSRRLESAYARIEAQSDLLSARAEKPAAAEASHP